MVNTMNQIWYAAPSKNVYVIWEHNPKNASTLNHGLTPVIVSNYKL